MNAKTFKLKEFLIYCIPIMAVDLVINIILYKMVAGVFRYWDPADLIMRKQKIVYFLIVSYFIAVAILPINVHHRGNNIWDVIARSFFQTVLTLSLFATSVFVLFGNFAGKLLLQDGIVASLSIIIWHLIARIAINIARRKGRNKVHCIIVGNCTESADLYKELNSDGEYKVLGIFTDDVVDSKSRIPVLGGTGEMWKYMKGNKVHSLFCSLNPAENEEKIREIIAECENLFIDFFYVPNMKGFLHRKMSWTEFGNVLVLNLREEPLSAPLNAVVKRTADIIISSLFLVTLFPIIFIFVAIGTRLSSPGPIFFKQNRTGYKGKSFQMLKFRSMKVNSDSDKIQATKDDPRKTVFGNFLRKTSIDELPQFINVLAGDMSIIGPRPHMEMHTETYNKLIDEYMVRHMVKPGLTGWAQVNGCRGETKEVSEMEDRVRHDIWYIENWTVWLDIRIFFMTIAQIFKGDKQAY